MLVVTGAFIKFYQWLNLGERIYGELLPAKLHISVILLNCDYVSDQQKKKTKSKKWKQRINKIKEKKYFHNKNI